MNTWRWLIGLAALAAVTACHDSRQVADSNTNWLRECGDDGDCRVDDQCVCGVCTQSCVEDAMCSRPDGPPAQCVALDEGQCQGAEQAAVCLQSCERDRDCEPASFCRQGACQQRSASGGRERDAGMSAPPADAAASDSGVDAAIIDASGREDAGTLGEVGDPCGDGAPCRADLSCEEGTCRAPWSAAGCQPAQSNRTRCDALDGCPSGLVCHLDGSCIEPGRCDWSGRATLAEVGDVRALQSDATHLYLFDWGTRDGLGNHRGDGAIWRLQLDDWSLEPVVTALTSSHDSPTLLLDGDQVFWSEGTQTAEELWTYPKSGDVAPRLLTSGSFRSWAQDAQYLYYLDAEQLARVDKTTGTVEPIAPTAGWQFCIDGTAAYVCGTAGLEVIALDGSSATTALPGQCSAPALGRDEIFFQEGTTTELHSLPKAGGDVLNLTVLEPSDVLAPELLIHRQHVYFGRIVMSAGEMHLQRAPRDPGETETLAVLPLDIDRFAFTVSDRGLFWIEQGRLMRRVIADYQTGTGPAQGAAGGPCHGDLGCDPDLTCIDTLCE